MKINTVLFDLDGTLLDTLEDLKNAFNHALKSCGFPERTQDEIRRFVGNGVRMTLRRAAPEGTSEETLDALVASFTVCYKAHCADRTRPYSGVLELLKSLHASGIRSAVVSNKADYAVQELCEHFFPHLLEAVCGEKEGIRRKPAPDMVCSVMEQMRADPACTVYVGDSNVDIETAKNAGLACISVTWGFRNEAFLREHGAELIAHSPMEIADLLIH